MDTKITQDMQASRTLSKINKHYSISFSVSLFTGHVWMRKPFMPLAARTQKCTKRHGTTVFGIHSSHVTGYIANITIVCTLICMNRLDGLFSLHNKYLPECVIPSPDGVRRTTTTTNYCMNFVTIALK